MNQGEDELVMQIKGLQRSDPAAKEQWWAYCDSIQGGIRDPAKHDQESLMNFITQFSSGATFEKPAGGGSKSAGGANMSPLAGMVKGCQKMSTPFSECWKMYCENFGKGINDPARHDDAYISSFLEHIGSAGMMVPPRATMGAVGGMGGMGGGAKRGHMGMGGNTGQAGTPKMARMAKHETDGMIGMNPEKDAFALRVKNYQKSSEEAKQMWWNFCDTEHKGVRDPMRYDLDVLMGFCLNFGVP